MKKKKSKMLRNLLFFVIFAGISIIAFNYFNVYDKILEYTMENGINIGNVYVVKPKVKIIDEDSKTRPIAVSINNNHAAYPHAGLQDAYLAYELIAEGGITRIIALFKDQTTKKIGSVRSARHYFLDYVLENDAIFVHYGHSPQALSDIKSLKINNINGMYDAKGFFRDTSLHRAYEHTAFTSMDRINKLIKSKKYRNTTEEQLLKYSPIKIEYKTENKKEANIVEIVYSSYQTTKYVYDPENMNYKMFMGGKEHTDLITKKQYTVKNIITYQVQNSSIQSDRKGRQDLYNVGNGEGYYISNGEAIKIKWSKKDRASKTIYTLEDGSELKVNDGNTWIHIQPKGKKLNIS